MKRITCYSVALLIVNLIYAFITLHFYSVNDFLGMFQTANSDPIQRLAFLVSIILTIFFAEMFYKSIEY